MRDRCGIAEPLTVWPDPSLDSMAS